MSTRDKPSRTAAYQCPTWLSACTQQAPHPSQAPTRWHPYHHTPPHYNHVSLLMSVTSVPCTHSPLPFINPWGCEPPHHVLPSAAHQHMYAFRMVPIHASLCMACQITAPAQQWRSLGHPKLASPPAHQRGPPTRALDQHRLVAQVSFHHHGHNTP